MYKVCGSNLHGQWFLPESVLSHFTNVETDGREFNVSKAELVVITWSYNVFYYKGDFYLAGSWLGTDNSMICLNLPNVGSLSFDKEEPEFAIVGNDQKLIVLNKKTCELWILEFNTFRSWNWEYKYVHFKNRRHITLDGQRFAKKLKIEKHIKKAVLSRNSLHILTNDGSLYDNLVSVNTSHCLGEIIDIECGYEHFVLLTDKGKVYTWGNGRRCQLGHNNLENLLVPTKVEALEGVKIVKIKTGGWHTLALSDTGDLYVWGWNNAGQLGTHKMNASGVFEEKDAQQSQDVPTLVDFLDDNRAVLELNVIDMACGSRHSIVMLEDNTVWGTGFNKYGQLGFDPEVSPALSFFMRIYECEPQSSLFAGFWSTVVYEKDA